MWRTHRSGTLQLSVPTEPASFRPAAWPELIAACLAIAGVLALVLSGYHTRASQASASDFKTLYASAQCFRQHIDPYSFTNIAAVFQANRIVLPVTWYGHAPVYPPFTLAVMAPLTLLPMVQAIYLWIAISGLSLAIAVFLLTRAAADLFALPLRWRLALIAAFALFPLLRFSLQMGNVSAIVAALSIAAVTLSDTPPRLTTLPPILLAAALLLKPHLAVWVVLAFFVSRQPRDRRLAATSLALFLLALLSIALWMAAHHQLGPELAAYRAMVQQEVAGGSMDSTLRDTVAVAAQITSLASLLGYWLTGLPLLITNAALLIALFVALTWFSLSTQTQAIDTTLLRVGAWSAFGLLATYHRAHDGLVLLILLPCLLSWLRTSRKDPAALLLLGSLLCLSGGPSAKAFRWLATLPGLTVIAHFLLYRQSALAALLVALLLLHRVRVSTKSPELLRE